ncbi:MAG: hypothetical protein WC047_04815 [Kiritimatiellales bacterium]
MHANAREWLGIFQCSEKSVPQRSWFSKDWNPVNNLLAKTGQIDEGLCHELSKNILPLAPASVAWA